MDLVSEVVSAAIRPGRGAIVAIARLRHRDRLRRAMWTSRLAKRLYYTEPDWVMIDVPVQGGFGIDVSRCVIAEFFASLGMPEFCQRVICDQDARDATYRGIDFERTGTLAGGASRCDFRYHVRSGRQVDEHGVPS
jgi:ubiquinone biosynthesis protein